MAPRRLAADRTPWSCSQAQRGVTGDDVTAGACWRRNLEETIMLRKLSLVAVAAASLGRGRAGADLRLGLGRLARWLAPRLGLGWPAHRCRRACLLRRLWRLLCAATGADPLGSPLAPGQPLLLIRSDLPPDCDAPAILPGLFCSGGTRSATSVHYLQASARLRCDRKQIPQL